MSKLPDTIIFQSRIDPSQIDGTWCEKGRNWVSKVLKTGCKYPNGYAVLTILGASVRFKNLRPARFGGVQHARFCASPVAAKAERSKHLRIWNEG